MFLHPDDLLEEPGLRKWCWGLLTTTLCSGHPTCPSRRQEGPLGRWGALSIFSESPGVMPFHTSVNAPSQRPPRTHQSFSSLLAAVRENIHREDGRVSVKGQGKERRKMSQNSGFGEVVTWGGSKEAGIHCGLRSARNQGNPRIVSKSIRSPERLQTRARPKL